MAKLYMLVGLPGSGKSTIAEELDGVHISSDEIRECLYGSAQVQPEDPKRVFAFMDSASEDCLKDGRNVVYDATNLTEENRVRTITRLKLFADEVICVQITTPVEECLRRNARRSRVVTEERIRQMAEIFETPTVQEGFSKLVLV